MGCIYKLISPEGKLYIGYSKTTFEDRFESHLSSWLRCKKNGQKYDVPKLYKAFDEWSPDEWRFQTMFISDNLETLKQKEIDLIFEFDATNENIGYNVLLGGQTGWSGLNLSEGHKTNQSIARKAWYETEEGKEWKNILREKFTENNPSFKGMEARVKTHSQKTKNSISETKKEYYKTHEHICKGVPKTAEQRRKISETKKSQNRTRSESEMKAICKTYRIIDPYGKSEIITNMAAYCRLHNLSASNMTSLATGMVKNYKGYKVELITT